MNDAYKHIQILLVDDEPDILEILEYNLSRAGFNVSRSENGKDALEKAEQIIPDLIILDLMMPGIDGIETCKRLRENPDLQNTIIVFLTARSEDFMEVSGYGAGADDYITKPIRPKVFVSKVKALLRRLENNNKEKISVGNLVIDRNKYLVIIEDKELHLPPKEFELLTLLASNPEKAFDRETILSTVWGDEVVVGDRTIDVHIRKLREKIGSEKIKTLTGIGYKFVS